VNPLLHRYRGESEEDAAFELKKQQDEDAYYALKAAREQEAERRYVARERYEQGRDLYAVDGDPRTERQQEADREAERALLYEQEPRLH
jgi:hypothetical protein